MRIPETLLRHGTPKTFQITKSGKFPAIANTLLGVFLKAIHIKNFTDWNFLQASAMGGMAPANHALSLGLIFGSKQPLHSGQLNDRLDSLRENLIEAYASLGFSKCSGSVVILPGTQNKGAEKKTQKAMAIIIIES